MYWLDRSDVARSCAIADVRSDGMTLDLAPHSQTNQPNRLNGVWKLVGWKLASIPNPTSQANGNPFDQPSSVHKLSVRAFNRWTNQFLLRPLEHPVWSGIPPFQHSIFELTTKCIKHNGTSWNYAWCSFLENPHSYLTTTLIYCDPDILSATIGIVWRLTTSGPVKNV